MIVPFLLPVIPSISTLWNMLAGALLLAIALAICGMAWLISVVFL